MNNEQPTTDDRRPSTVWRVLGPVTVITLPWVGSRWVLRRLRDARWWRRLGRWSANAAHLLWLSSRLTLGTQALVLIAAAIGVFAYAALSEAVSTKEAVFSRLLLVETVVFVILSMGLLPREKEGRTLEVLLTSARSRHALILMKFVPVLLFVAVIAAGLTLGFYWLTGGVFSWAKMWAIPYLLAVTVGVLTVALSMHLRNQYAAAVVALLVAVVFGILWFEPFTTFYDAPVRRMMRSQPNLMVNRALVAVVFGFLYDHSVRRLRRVELWMR
jgi:hypothetical protein